MKLKKKVRKAIILILVFTISLIAGLFCYKQFFTKDKKEEVQAVKVLDKLDEYGYSLKENKPKEYQKMFNELKEILKQEKVDEEEYAKKITEMFIYDFYSLDDKMAKTDVGGLDFVYEDAKPTFLQTAQNTFYKYVESNIYENREQELPKVDEITVGDIEHDAFAYGSKTDDDALYVKATWTYTEAKFQSYQKEATLVFIHDDKKLCLVELQD